jgi:hypothetical protein
MLTNVLQGIEAGDREIVMAEVGAIPIFENKEDILQQSIDHL